MKRPPVTYFNQQDASDAFAVLRALEERERAEPSLSGNSVWQAIRQQARDNFCNAFEVAK